MSSKNLGNRKKIVSFYFIGTTHFLKKLLVGYSYVLRLGKKMNYQKLKSDDLLAVILNCIL